VTFVFSALIGLALTLLVPARLWGQGCCTPGTSPMGGLTGSALSPWRVEIGLDSEGYDLRQAFDGDAPAADPAGRHSQVGRVLVWARVGLPGEVVLVVDLPYEHRMREQPQPLGAPGEMFRLSNTALGDLSTSVIVRLAPRGRPKPWGVDAGAGMKWGTGSVERREYGLTLPVELQTGTGSNDPLAMASGYHVWPSASVTLATLARFPREGRNGYQYGTEAHAVALGDWAPRPWWALGGELRLRAAAADQYVGLPRPNTGGWRLMAGPTTRITWRAAGLALEGGYLWPVHQHLNGLQIGVDRQAILGVRWQPS